MDLETISRQDRTLTKELAYLLGVYLTDGSITKKNFNLQVIDKNFAERVLIYLQKIKPKTQARLRIRKDVGSWNKLPRHVVKVGLGDYAEWFMVQTNHKHHVPIDICSAPKGIKRWFIAGVMDGDGWISKTKRQNSLQYQYRIGIGGVTEGWIWEFRDLLISMGVKCNKIEKILTKNGKWFCRFTVNPRSFFDAKLFFKNKRKAKRCAIASTTTR